MNIINFIVYLWVTAITPGPNNIMSMNFGTRLGFRKSLPFNLGVFLGVLLISFIAAFLGHAIFTYLPGIKSIMKWIGIAYLLWLAWHTFKAGPISAEDHFDGATLPRGAILQFINVKVIIYSITSMSTFVLPFEANPLIISLWVIVMASIAFISTCVWSAFGSIFRTLFRDHYRLVNTIMALLLVYCAWTLLD